MEPQECESRVGGPQLDRPQQDSEVVATRAKLRGNEYDLVAVVDAYMPAGPQSLAEAFRSCTKGELEHECLVERFSHRHAASIATRRCASLDTLGSFAQRRSNASRTPSATSAIPLTRSSVRLTRGRRKTSRP